MSFGICMKISFIKFYLLSLPFTLVLYEDSILIFHSSILGTHNFLGTRLNKRSVSNLFVLLYLWCALANILIPYYAMSEVDEKVCV